METLYIFADNEIMEVTAFNGTAIDAKVVSIPLTRVERFCNKDGNISTQNFLNPINKH